MKLMRNRNDIGKITASRVADSSPRQLMLLCGAFVGSIIDLLLLLKRAGMEEEGYAVLRENIQQIIYEE